jgi:curved DNA-binding protein CbpA
MLISEYYNILGIPLNSSLEDIKKAYRNKARLYHPDINRTPGAKEKFIEATEAYDFLMAHHEKGQLDNEDYFRIVESGENTGRTDHDNVHNIMQEAPLPSSRTVNITNQPGYSISLLPFLHLQFDDCLHFCYSRVRDSAPGPDTRY